jgi:hypothetical protein
MARTWTDEQLIDAVKTSKTKAEVTEKLGLKPPGSYTIITKYIKLLNLDTSHFNSYLNTHAKVILRKNEELFVENGISNRNTVRRRIIDEKILPYKCSMCGISDWQDKPLSLQLDHINGIPTDHRLENLRFLCPNCHTQTGTYSHKKTRGIKQPEKICQNCGVSIKKYGAKLCMSCKAANQIDKNTKIDWPDNEELIDMIRISYVSDVARKLGVSDNAIRYRLMNRGLWPIPQ